VKVFLDMFDNYSYKYLIQSEILTDVNEVQLQQS